MYLAAIRCLITGILLFVVLQPAVAQVERSELIPQAVNAVSSPVVEHGKQRPHQHQVKQRLEKIPARYYYQSADAEQWLGLLNNESADVYARLSAASLLYQDSEEARGFIDTQLQCKNYRYRFNAAVALAAAVRGTDCLAYRKAVALLQNKELEETPPASQQSMEGNFELGDARDIESPIAQLCFVVGLFKDPAIEPLLLEIFRRHKDKPYIAQHIASGLAMIDSQQASSCLLELLGSNEVIHDCNIVFRLGMLGDKQAVPKLCEILNARKTAESAGMSNMLNRYLLQALKTLHDPNTIPEIELFLKSREAKDLEKFALTTIESLKDEERLRNIVDKLDTRMQDSKSVAGIAFELGTYADMAVLPALDDIARNSDFAQDRTIGIMAMAKIGDKDAIYMLAQLLEVEFPSTLISNNPNPDQDIDESLKEEISRNLRYLTNHNFGLDSERWTEFALQLGK